ncbi:hypothetical protein B0T22DRAFT_440730 [Podospora appendiculata]|uniref:Uncharacterized protein n=1 Tax=Podospora appendiculata TaxID=314037 RepID=A0AAE0XB77_9PEZI|nr:hypothetical protein B0T22DRAFT_440730 [Podospora appendiculata]
MCKISKTFYYCAIGETLDPVCPNVRNGRNYVFRIEWDDALATQCDKYGGTDPRDCPGKKLTERHAKLLACGPCGRRINEARGSRLEAAIMQERKVSVAPAVSKATGGRINAASAHEKKASGLVSKARRPPKASSMSTSRSLYFSQLEMRIYTASIVVTFDTTGTSYSKRTIVGFLLANFQVATEPKIYTDPLHHAIVPARQLWHSLFEELPSDVKSVK